MDNKKIENEIIDFLIRLNKKYNIEYKEVIKILYDKSLKETSYKNNRINSEYIDKEWFL